MVDVALGAGRAYACNGCGAVFLGHAHAARVRAGLDRAAAVVAERGAQHRPAIDQPYDTAPLACPCCSVAMQPEWVSERQLRIDHCLQHGTFFDAHELAALVPRQRQAHPETRLGRDTSGYETAGGVALEIIGTILLGGD
jgi:Zn-finger nucleic acid-binding protein